MAGKVQEESEVRLTRGYCWSRTREYTGFHGTAYKDRYGRRAVGYGHLLEPETGRRTITEALRCRRA